MIDKNHDKTLDFGEFEDACRDVLEITKDQCSDVVSQK